MSRTITIAGSPRPSSDLIDKSLKIVKVLSDVVDTSTMKLRNEKPVGGQEIIVDDSAQGVMFRGVIDKVAADQRIPEFIWKVDAQDHTYSLDARLVVEVYEGWAGDAIAKDLVAKYAPGFTCNNVQAGAPVIEKLVFNYVKISACLKELCKYIGWEWYVDDSKDIHLFDPATLNAPAPISITPTTLMSKFKYVVDTSGLRNRVFIVGGTMLSDLQRPLNWEADGAARQWALPYEPYEITTDGEEKTIKVNGVRKTVGIENVDDESLYDYLVHMGTDKYLRCSEQTATPIKGHIITMAAKMKIDLITMVEDIASQKAVAIIQGAALFCTFNMVADVNACLYIELSTVSDYVVQEGDYLEYDVRWGPGCDSRTAVELVFSTSPSLKDSGAIDQNGVSVHPATDLRAYANDRWYHRKISFPEGSIGSSVTKYEIACEAKDGSAKVGYVRNIVITDGAGTIRKVVWTSGDQVPYIVLDSNFPESQTYTIVKDNDGVYEHVIPDDTISTLEAAETLGNEDLAEHANPPVTGSLEDGSPGWSPGQILPIDLPLDGLQNNYVVQKVTIQAIPLDGWWYTIEWGGRLKGVADELVALASAQQKKNVNESTILHKFTQGQEVVEISDELVLTSKEPPYHYDDPDALYNFAVCS